MSFETKIKSIKLGCYVMAGLSLAMTQAKAYEFPSTSSAIHSEHTETLKAISQGVSEVAEKSGKALVFISVQKLVKGMPTGGIDPFEFFFGMPRRGQPPIDRNYQPRQQQQPKMSGLGSGFMVDLKEGYILTNNHVIEDADEIEVKLANGKTYEAKVVGRDKNTDVAVVKIKDDKYDRSGLTTLSFAKSADLHVGDFVVALGAPFGLQASVSFGVVSALNRRGLRITELEDFIQTDAAINPGNSGGPLLNSFGEVVGINSAIYSKAGGYNGIGFAIPSDLAKSISKRLIEDGKVARGFIGVSLQELNDNLRSAFGVSKNVSGALITKINKGGPADRGDLQEGDVIYKIQGKTVTNPSEVAYNIGLIEPGTDIKIGVYRKGKLEEVEVKLDEYPGDPNSPNSSAPASKQSLGLSLQPLTEQDRRQNNIESSEGLLIVDIEPDSRALTAGLHVGDVILSVNNKSISSIADFKKAVNKNGSNLLRIERQGQYFYASIQGDLG